MLAETKVKRIVRETVKWNKNVFHALMGSALASAAKGSSPYADGYVNLLAKWNEQPTLCTIMVQAKDYFSSSINFKELQENVKRCHNEEDSGIPDS